MNPLSAALWTLPFAGAVFLWALIAGRAGTSACHTRAFYAGLAGLLAIPLWLAAFAAMVAQLFWATFASPAGVLFIFSSLVLVAALATSIVLLVQLRTIR